MSGHEHAPAPQQLHPDVIKRDCSGEETGCFLWDYDVTDGVVKFKTRILVRTDVSGAKLQDVLQHERHHWSDFNRRAVALKAAAEKAVKEGRDPELDDRLEWMLYDYCKDAEAYHRSLDRLSFDSCSEPRTTRPK